MQALALTMAGKAEDAEPMARKCLEAAKKLPGDASEQQKFVASCQNCLSQALRELGRLEEAEATCREGLSIREKVREYRGTDS